MSTAGGFRNRMKLRPLLERVDRQLAEGTVRLKRLGLYDTDGLGDDGSIPDSLCVRCPKCSTRISIGDLKPAPDVECPRCMSRVAICGLSRSWTVRCPKWKPKAATLPSTEQLETERSGPYGRHTINDLIALWPSKIPRSPSQVDPSW